MCNPAIAYGIMAVASVYAASQAGKVPDMPEPTKPEAPKQASKDPDVKALRGMNMASSAGPNANAGGTLLTGPKGVDPNQLVLGKNTLLGGAGGGG